MGGASFSFSTLLRTPNRVLPALEQGDVCLVRRATDDLVLATKAKADARDEALVLLSRTLQRLARRHPTAAARLLAEDLPWLHWLPADAQAVCVTELLDDLAACSRRGDFARFTQNHSAWRRVAEAWADARTPAYLPSRSPLATPTDTR